MEYDAVLETINSVKTIKDAKKLIKSIPVVGEGSSRTALDIGNGLILKVAYNKYGIIQNREEVKLWNSVNKVQKRRLAKIIYSTKYCIIMERVRTNLNDKLKSYEFEKFKNELSVIDDQYGYLNAEDIGQYYKTLDGYVNRICNLGFNSKNKLVIYDYGFSLLTEMYY